MNKLKSLALTFALATAGFMGLAGSAQAQTNSGVSVTQTQTAQTDLVQNNYADPAVMQAMSNLPILRENYFPRAQVAFTTARVDQTGENIAVQWQLNGNSKTPVGVYNMDDPSGQSQQAYLNARADASSREASLTPVVVAGGPRYFAPIPIIVPTYTYIAPIRPVVIFGPVFNPWHPGRIFAPAPWDYGRGYNHGHNTTIIINGGHNDHRGGGYDRGHDRGGWDNRGPQHGHRR